jgi:hypothetical protein
MSVMKVPPWLHPPAGADQSAEHRDREAFVLHLRFGTAARVAGQHFERANLVAGQARDLYDNAIASLSASPAPDRCSPVEGGLHRAHDDFRDFVSDEDGRG